MNHMGNLIRILKKREKWIEENFEEYFFND
jgi:hypothetical protein